MTAENSVRIHEEFIFVPYHSARWRLGRSPRQPSREGKEMNSQFHRACRAVLACAILCGSGAPALAGTSFLGVAAGDAGSDEATVWTRATDSTAPGAAVAVTLQYSTDNTFTTGVTSQSVTTSTAAAGDNTAKYTITGLSPATRYYYRFIGSGGEPSNTGTFKTAPAP